MPNERDPLVIGARRLVTEVWKLVEQKRISSRSPAADAALDLRDILDPQWQPTALAICPRCDVPIIEHDDVQRKQCHDALSGYRRP
jgi:hypothetical protein